MYMFSFPRSYTPVNAITFLKLLCIFTLAALETFDFVWKIGNCFFYYCYKGLYLKPQWKLFLPELVHSIPWSL